MKTPKTPKPSTTAPTTAPLPLDAPSWAETLLSETRSVLSEVRSGTERLKGTIETLLARDGKDAALTEILQRLEAVASATRVAATASDLSAARGELRALGVELRGFLLELRQTADAVLSTAQAAERSATTVEERTRQEAAEADALADEAPPMGVVKFLLALRRPDVQAGLGRLIQAASRLGAGRAALPPAKAPLSLPEKTAD